MCMTLARLVLGLPPGGPSSGSFKTTDKAKAPVWGLSSFRDKKGRPDC